MRYSLKFVRAAEALLEMKVEEFQNAISNNLLLIAQQIPSPSVSDTAALSPISKISAQVSFTLLRLLCWS
jgi:hypothetical protein